MNTAAPSAGDFHPQGIRIGDVNFWREARADGPWSWYWRDEQCDEPMGPFETRAEALQDCLALRKLRRDSQPT